MTNMQVAFDAIRANARFIPRALPPFAVGGYINGAITEFQWEQSTWDMFPDSYHIRINVTGEPDRGNALDVEKGDASPGHVQPWIETRGPVVQGPLLVYCNRSNMDACIAARNAAKKATGLYAFIWAATLDGTITDRAMTQFAQQRANGTAVADVSLIISARLIDQMSAVLHTTISP